MSNHILLEVCQRKVEKSSGIGRGGGGGGGGGGVVIDNLRSPCEDKLVNKVKANKGEDERCLKVDKNCTIPEGG